MKLSVFKDNLSIKEVDFSDEVVDSEGELSFFIGRSDDCHLILDDKKISREHAKIIFNKNKWNIKRTSEFGDILLNGSKIVDSELSNGDIILIGPYMINVNLAKMEAISDAAHEVEVNIDEIPRAEADSLDLQANEIDLASELEDPKDEVSNNFEDVSDLDAEVKGEDNDQVKSLDDEFQMDIEDSENSESDSSEESGLFGSSEDFSPDDSGVEDGFELDSVDDDSATRVVQTFANFKLKLVGPNAPYDEYIISDNEVFIGRDSEKCKIVLDDPEVSSTHAVLRKTSIVCTIEDLNSGNGTILNESRINKSSLTNGDIFTIGSTEFHVSVTSDLLDREKDRLMPVEENQVIEVEEVLEVSTDFNEQEEGINLEGGSENKSLFSMESLKDPEKRKKILIYAVVILGVWVVLDDEPKKKVVAKKDDKKTRRLVKKKEANADKSAKFKELTEEEQKFVSSQYELVLSLFQDDKYERVIYEAEKIINLDPNFKQIETISQSAQEGLAKLEEIELKKQKKIEDKLRAKKVAELVERAKEAVAKRKPLQAEQFFSKIFELDPENFDVPQLKIEIDSWKREQEDIARKKAEKIADRKKKESLLQPGKTLYMAKKWYIAIRKLEEFLRVKEMDDDLSKQGSNMLVEARNNLKVQLDPLLGKSRSLREGQDLKGSYEQYFEILKIDPSNVEALDEMNEIREILFKRAKKVYREALISESLSLFNEAKEKYQEVQQIAPFDSIYYTRATNKLKNFLD